MKLLCALFLLFSMAWADTEYSYKLAYRFTNELGSLSPNEVYEGWIVTADGPMSTGRFNGQLEGTMLETRVTLPFRISSNADFVLTIEPRNDPDPAPSVHRLASGAFNSRGTIAKVNTDEIWGEDFCQNLGGTFFLATPTSPATDDDCLGIWVFEPPPGPDAGISLPLAPPGFTYEGWVVNTQGARPLPKSFGTFSDPNMPDSDGAGPTAGSDLGAAPPFPGSDFINPPTDLCMGYDVVITVEPSPDSNPETPFFWKPLAAPIDSSLVGPANPQQFNVDRSMFPNFVVEARWISTRQNCRQNCLEEYRECLVNGECNDPPTSAQEVMCFQEIRACKRTCRQYRYHRYY